MGPDGKVLPREVVVFEVRWLPEVSPMPYHKAVEFRGEIVAKRRELLDQDLLKARMDAAFAKVLEKRQADGDQAKLFLQSRQAAWKAEELTVLKASDRARKGKAAAAKPPKFSGQGSGVPQELERWISAVLGYMRAEDEDVARWPVLAATYLTGQAHEFYHLQEMDRERAGKPVTWDWLLSVLRGKYIPKTQAAKVGLDTVARLIVRRTEPHVKLH
jgi:hypothetical protein